jgi:hypothetical protein
MISSLIPLLTRHGWKIILVLILAAAAYIFSAHLRGPAIAHERQQLFLQHLSEQKRHRALLLVSPTYTDVWQFDRSQLELALRDLHSQFLSLQITPTDEVWTENTSHSCTYTARLRVTGTGIGPVAPMILSEAARIQTPFTFHWERTSWWPWSWKLTHISHPDFQPPAHYTPGMLSSEASLNDLLNQAQEKLN